MIANALRGVPVPGSQVLTASRVPLYAYAIAATYAAFLVSVFTAGTWIVDAKGVPVYTDFTSQWIGAVQAAHGRAESLYEPNKFVAAQASLAGQSDFFYPNWPYPPTYLLVLVPFTVFPYLFAFVGWETATLVGCIGVIYGIVRRPAAIPLVLAWPYSAWNLLAGQNGFLTASLLGAGLFLLKRKPVLAGVFIGGLTYKPQFGLLLPVALLATGLWPAVASAATTTVLLAAASAVAFGAGVWISFPRQLLSQTGLNLFADADSAWGYLQTVYGLVRSLHGGAAVAWLAQGLATLAAAVLVWSVWRSAAAFSLKAAILSAATIIATPCAFAYDMATIVVPAAFLVRDQLQRGFLKGEQLVITGLFLGLVALLVFLRDPPQGIVFGSLPIAPLILITVLTLALRRLRYRESEVVLQ